MKIIENLPMGVLKALGAVGARMPKQILSLRYRRWTGQWIDWAHPAELQQVFLSQMIKECGSEEGRRRFAMLADKVAVRSYVAERVGEESMARLYGTWRRVEDIDWDGLPERFVMKTNNGCGTNVVVRDKSKLDIEVTKRNLRRWMKFPYGALTGQIHYSFIEPMILAEELLETDSGPDKLPEDYKLFCCDGEPRFFLYYEDRRVNGHLTKNAVFDTEWNEIKGVARRPTNKPIAAPGSLAEMVAMARELSRGLGWVRIDMYDVKGRAVFGEVTLTPDVVSNFTESFRREVIG